MPPQTAPLSQHLPQRLPDLHAARLAVQQGHTSFTELMEQSITAAQAPACAHVFSRTDFVTARQRAQQADAEQLAQPAFFSAASRQPLAGLAVSIKDLFDIADQPTPAGSLALADAPAATQDAAAVARLRSAGAAWVGRTNMVEFAFSGVGVNPHFGTPTAWDARTGAVAGGDPATPRVPGGSSSGAGVSVATGAAFVGLGSDTGGSIRIPAALNGIVGFKSTARLVPTRGAVPLSTTLDTACAMTRSVRDAMLVHEVLAARSVVRSTAPLSSYRLAVARTTFLDGLDATVATAFERRGKLAKQPRGPLDRGTSTGERGRRLKPGAKRTAREIERNGVAAAQAEAQTNDVPERARHPQPVRAPTRPGRRVGAARFDKPRLLKLGDQPCDARLAQTGLRDELAPSELTCLKQPLER